MQVTINFEKSYERPKSTRDTLRKTDPISMYVKDGSLQIKREGSFDWWVCSLHQQDLKSIPYNPILIEKILKQLEKHELNN